MTKKTHIDAIKSKPVAPTKAGLKLINAWRDASNIGHNVVSDDMLASVLTMARDDQKSEKTRLGTGKELCEYGVFASDFSAKSAKESGRESFFKLVTWLAMLLFDKKVTACLVAYSAKKTDGALIVHGVFDEAGKELTIRDWAQKVPSKRAVLKRALEAWLRYRDQSEDKRGARVTKSWSDSRLAELERIVATCADEAKFEATGCGCDPHQLGAVAALAIAIVKGKGIESALKRVNARLS